MTTQSITTRTAPTIVRRLAGLGAMGTLALGGVAVAGDVSGLTAPPAAAAGAAGPNQPVFEAITQFQGQGTQNEDCGPTAAVIAMRAEGYAPTGFDQGPRSAIEAARADTGLATGPTVEQHMLNIFAAQGVPADADTDVEGALQAVRDGKSAIVNGNMQALPYVYDYTGGVNPNIVHAVVITDYDAENDTYLLLDPNHDGGGVGVEWRVTADEVRTYQASVAPYQHQTVVG